MLAWFVNLFESGALKAADMDTVTWDSRMAKADMDAFGAQLVQAVIKAGARGVGEAKKQLFNFSY